jgi:ubiquinone/menaquinone biosynthesis C-methylase UbiE
LSQEENVKSAFDQFAIQYEALYMDVSRYEEGLNVFYNSISSSAPSILDIACGPGNLSRFIKDVLPNSKIIGFDISPKMIQLAKENVKDGQFTVSDLSFLKKDHHQYDGILIGFLLPYISPSEFNQLLKDCYHALKFGGILYFSGNEGPPEKSGLEFGSANTGPGIMNYYYEIDSLENSLHEEGLELVWKNASLHCISENRNQLELEIIALKC